LPNDVIEIVFTARNSDPLHELTWGDFRIEGPQIAIQPTFDPVTRLLTWDTTGSPQGVYGCSMTASDSLGGCDVGTVLIGLGVDVVDVDYSDGDDSGGPTIPGGAPEIPEPATATMACVGLGVYVMRQHRRKSLAKSRRSGQLYTALEKLRGL
jgi:hypothetical protein